MVSLVNTKKRLLKMHFNSNKGHIGGNLSCLDALFCLFHELLQEKDKFVLSKGHSVGALYAVLWSKKLLSDADLDSFCKDNTLFPGHPSGLNIPTVIFPTGSLGHGFSLANGLALASKLSGEDNKIYCLCSDGEWQEGSTWEALIFSIHHKLDNLTIFIDKNNWQGFGSTDAVASMQDINNKIRSFNAHTIEVDGHNHNEIISACAVQVQDKPKIIILDTVKGKGTCFENTLASHYLPLSEEQYIDAINRL